MRREKKRLGKEKNDIKGKRSIRSFCDFERGESFLLKIYIPYIGAPPLAFIVPILKACRSTQPVGELH